ncbi:MAG: D-alanyl-D-alanine carboxypeptidase [Chlamydiae bacterium]|nr:D-alanyl-D-alanine carboxypeptidase [Chlamydiota bacterium]
MVIFFFLISPFGSVELFAGRPLRCDIPAPSAILISADTGSVLFEKNAYLQTFPASTTKIATALYALHKQGAHLTDMITVTYDAVGAVTATVRRNSGKHPSHRLEFGGSHMSLKAGEVISLKALLYGLLVCSGNDSANTIAEHVSGTVPKFMEEVNAYLRSIGCTSTCFANPHGLPDSRHLTTAYDLSRMAYVAMKYPFFREVVKSTRYTRPKTNKQEESILVQTNALLKPGKHYYPHAIGVKTGYTVDAGSNLVAAAEKDGRRVIAVVLNCQDMTERYRSCISLFEAAFNEVKVDRKLFSKMHDFFSATVKGAETPLEAHLQRDVVIEYYPSEEVNLEAKLEWYKVSLPIAQGQVVGEIQVLDENRKIVLTEPLLAKKNVSPTIAHIISQYAVIARVVIYQKRHWIAVAFGATFVMLAYALRRKKVAV